MTQPLRALRGLQRCGVEGADEGGRRDDERELREHLAGETGHESGGNEHRHEHERDADNRAEEFVHRPYCGVVAGESFLDIFRDAFDDHDGVVDHNADGKHDAEERREIDGEAQRRHRRERADDGDRHRRRRHQDRAEILQEDENDDQDENAGLPQRLVDLRDRVLNEDRRVVGNCIGETVREPFRQPVHRRLDFLADLQRIRFRRLIDRDACGGFSVDAKILRIGLGPQFDAREVAQMNEPAALLGLVLDDDAAEFVRLV